MMIMLILLLLLLLLLWKCHLYNVSHQPRNMQTTTGLIIIHARQSNFTMSVQYMRIRNTSWPLLLVKDLNQGIKQLPIPLRCRPNTSGDV